MIFVTSGTHEPFDRLLEAVDGWCDRSGQGDKVFAQSVSPGSGGYVPRNYTVVERLSPDEYAARFAEADLIVSHAGMGTILTALSMNKPAVIMPRRMHLHETRNDHQYSTVNVLGEYPGLFIASDEKILGEVVDHALGKCKEPLINSISQFASKEFTNELRKFIISGEK